VSFAGYHPSFISLNYFHIISYGQDAPVFDRMAQRGSSMGVWPVWELATLAFLGVGVPLAGVARWRRWDRLSMAVSGLMACFAVALAFTDLPTYASITCGLCAFAYFVVVVALALPPVQRLGSGLARIALQIWSVTRNSFRSALCSRALQALPFLVAGPLLTYQWACRLDKAYEIPDLNEDPFAGPPIELIAEPQQAYTDRGHGIQLHTGKIDDDHEQALADLENRFGQKFMFAIIRASKPDPSHNCYGWVFTGGRFWIDGDSVDLILADNGYQEVADPRAGDLITYRDRVGRSAHAGIVRSANENDVLVESKWGSLGRYLHAPAHQPFDKTWAYYRSPRHGHLLRIEPAVPLGSLISE
jgi:hypothetical protein